MAGGNRLALGPPGDWGGPAVWPVLPGRAVKPVNRYHTKVAPAGADSHQRHGQSVRRWDRRSPARRCARTGAQPGSARATSPARPGAAAPAPVAMRALTCCGLRQTVPLPGARSRIRGAGPALDPIRDGGPKQAFARRTTPGPYAAPGVDALVVEAHVRAGVKARVTQQMPVMTRCSALSSPDRHATYIVAAIIAGAACQSTPPGKAQSWELYLAACDLLAARRSPSTTRCNDLVTVTGRNSQLTFASVTAVLWAADRLDDAQHLAQDVTRAGEQPGSVFLASGGLLLQACVLHGRGALAGADACFSSAVETAAAHGFLTVAGWAGPRRRHDGAGGAAPARAGRAAAGHCAPVRGPAGRRTGQGRVRPAPRWREQRGHLHWATGQSSLASCSKAPVTAVRMSPA
jgi:hypothetical protein